MQSEIVNAADDAEAPFAVYPVTRDSVDTYASWPKWRGHIGWSGVSRGPSSPLIRPGDRLDLRIWDNSENSLLLSPGAKVAELPQMTVNDSGEIFVPYLDMVYVAGMSPDKARATVQEQLSVIVPAAQVQLGYAAGPKSSVSLVGGVARPGTHPLPDRNFSVLQLVSLGGGVPPDMRNPRVTLVRDGRRYRTSLDRLYDDPSADVILRGGDKVIVEEDDRHFIALGASGKENLIYFTEEELNALQALSLSGGLNESRADPKGVLILRSYGPKDVRTDGKGPARQDVVFTIDLTSADGLFSARRFAIHPGDVVLATESPAIRTQTIFALLGGALGVARTADALTE